MAVQSSKDGGAATAGELVKRAEMEVKTEKEVSGDFEHIASRDGDDYDSNETEGSFVMVKSIVDSDGRSDSSEREIELDVDGGVGDASDASGSKPPVTSWGSSTLLDGESVDEGKIDEEIGRDGKGDKEVGMEEIKEEAEDISEGGNHSQAVELVHVTHKEDSTITYLEHPEGDEEMSENLTFSEKQQQKEVLSSKQSKGEKEPFIEYLSVEEKLTVVDDSKNIDHNLFEEDVMAVEDSKGKVDEVSQDISNEKDAVASIQKQASEGTEALSPITSSDALNAEDELNSVLEEREVVDSSITQDGNKDFKADFEIGETKKINGDRSGNAEIDSTSEIKERKYSGGALESDFATSITYPGNEEVKSIYDFEDKRVIDDEENQDVKFSTIDPLEGECKDAKDEGNKETESSIAECVEHLGSASPDGLRKIDDDNITNCGDGETEYQSASQEDKNQQSEQVQQGIDAPLAKPASEEKADASFTELITPLVKNIGSSFLADQYKDVEAPTVTSSPVSINMTVKLAPQIDDEHKMQAQVVDTSIPMSDSEEKVLDSSIESIAEPAKEIIGSSSINDDCQIAEASSISQNPESVHQDVDLDSHAENKYMDAFFIASPTNIIDRTLTQDIIASQSKTDSEDKEPDSSLQLLAKENNVSPSVVEQSMVSEASSIELSPVSANETINLTFVEENKFNVLSTANQTIKNSPTYSDWGGSDSMSYGEQVQQVEVDASLSKSDNEVKGCNSSSESLTESANDNNVSSSLCKESQVLETSSNGESPDRISRDVNFATDIVKSSLKQPVEHLLQHHVDASLSKSGDEEKEHDSSSELIDEPFKENIGSSSIVVKYLVAEGPYITQNSDGFNEDTELVSQLEDKHVVNLSMVNQQRNGSSRNSDSMDRDLRIIVEQGQPVAAYASLSKCAVEEKESDSCIELISEQVNENDGSSFMVDNYQVVEPSSSDQNLVGVKENISFFSQAEDKCDDTLLVEENLAPFKEDLVSATETEVIHNDKMPSIYSNPEPKEEIGLASNVEGKQDEDVLFIDRMLEPIQTSLEKSHDGDIDLTTNPTLENVSSTSKTEDSYNLGAFITKGVSGSMELKPAVEVAVLEMHPVEDLKRIENQQSDLKSVKDLDFGKVVDMDNQRRELKSATVRDKPVEIHLDKELGEIKELPMESKADNKHAAVHLEQSQRSAAPSTSDGDVEKSELHAKKHYIIKIPRFTQRVLDNELQEKVHEAQMKVDENTRNRDSIMVELENMRKVLSDCCHKRDTAIEEEKKARTLLNVKRQEMDSLQLAISKGKMVASFLDITSQIHTLTHKMQHETITLKEEKKLLHELNQLKSEQEHHTFSKCSKPEIDEVMRQKEKAESSLKTLKKEFDILRSTHIKADEFAKVASKGYSNQFSKVKDQEKKWRTANELRQNAFKDLHGLKSDKMVHFWKYVDDKQAARNYASSKDREALERHCTEQIDRVLQLWNEDEDFRRHYIESNVNSTLRRFGTLDGRSVGVNEVAVVLPSRAPPRSTTRNLTAPVKVGVKQPENAQVRDKSALQTTKLVRPKPSSMSTSMESTPPIVSVEEKIVEAEQERKLREEEVQVRLDEEKERKEEEEKSKEKEAMELKEKIRMEQKAKAKEAEERKRRKSEKARARAEYKAQKEAELREQKKAKKEKKDDFPETTETTESENASVMEISSYEASPELEKTSKRSSRSSAVALNKFTTRVQPVPLPLRKKGKRKTSMLVWSLCGAVAVGGLVFAGNYISFSGISLLDFSF